MFVNSIAIWFKNDYRSDGESMVMLYPRCLFSSAQAIIEWAFKQRVNMTHMLAYDGRAQIVAVWPDA